MDKINHIWGERHSIILDEFLKSLSAAGIKYFILRNYEGLPEKNESKDVDIIIQPGKYKEASKILLSVFKKNNVPNYHMVRFERVRCWIGMDLKDEFSIHIDLIEGYLNKGFEIFDFDILYKNTRPFKNYVVLNDAYDVVMLLLYKVIACKELKDRYIKRIEKGYSQNTKKINEILVWTLGENFGKSAIKALEEKNYKWIIENAKSFSSYSKKKAFLRHPLKTIYNAIYFWMEKIYHLGICPKKLRKMIAVEAPDGAGKTTFIDNLCVILSQMYVSDLDRVHVYHFRPEILPNLGAVGEKAGVMKQDTDFTNPHRNKPANPLSSFVRMIYYWLDYVVGGFMCIRKDVQFDRISIYDRYIYDFIVDPHRSRINLPRFVRVMFSKLVQKPKVTFILSAKAETIYARKQELTMEEIERQLGEFSKLKKTGKGFIELNAEKSPEEIAMNAAEIVIDLFTNKVK